MSGAGVSINPIAFLIVENDKVRLLPVNHSSCIDKMLDYIPDLFERLSNTACKLNKDMSCENSDEEKEEECKEKIKKSKPHISKIVKTTEEKLEYKPKIKVEKENQEIAEELEEIFEEEYEYEDD